MEELMDMIAADESPSGITDKIKEILYAKAADKVWSPFHQVFLPCSQTHYIFLQG